MKNILFLYFIVAIIGLGINYPVNAQEDEQGSKWSPALCTEKIKSTDECKDPRFNTLACKTKNGEIKSRCCKVTNHGLKCITVEGVPVKPTTTTNQPALQEAKDEINLEGNTVAKLDPDGRPPVLGFIVSPPQQGSFDASRNPLGTTTTTEQAPENAVAKAPRYDAFGKALETPPPPEQVVEGTVAQNVSNRDENTAVGIDDQITVSGGRIADLTNQALLINPPSQIIGSGGTIANYQGQAVEAAAAQNRNDSSGFLIQQPAQERANAEATAAKEMEAARNTVEQVPEQAVEVTAAQIRAEQQIAAREEQLAAQVRANAAAAEAAAAEAADAEETTTKEELAHVANNDDDALPDKCTSKTTCRTKSGGEGFYQWDNRSKPVSERKCKCVLNPLPPATITPEFVHGSGGPYPDETQRFMPPPEPSYGSNGSGGPYPGDTRGFMPPPESYRGLNGSGGPYPAQTQGVVSPEFVHGSGGPYPDETQRFMPPPPESYYGLDGPGSAYPDETQRFMPPPESYRGLNGSGGARPDDTRNFVPPEPSDTPYALPE